MKRLALVLILLLAAGVFAATVLADTPPPTTTTTTTATTTSPGVVPTGVTLAGVQIGGLAPDVATAAVLQAFEQPVILHFEKTTISVSPNLLGVTVPADAAVAKAMTVAPNTTLPALGSPHATVHPGARPRNPSPRPRQPRDPLP